MKGWCKRGVLSIFWICWTKVIVKLQKEVMYTGTLIFPIIFYYSSARSVKISNCSKLRIKILLILFVNYVRIEQSICLQYFGMKSPLFSILVLMNLYCIRIFYNFHIIKKKSHKLALKQNASSKTILTNCSRIT